MKITLLQRQKKNRHRVSVYLDGEFAFGLNDECVFKFGLHKGMELDAERQREIELYDQRVQAKRIAERYVGARMRSVQEVRKRLREKEISDDVIEETVETFLRVRLLDDTAFAEAWVRDRLRLRPRAASLLRRELRGKGVKQEIINDVLSRMIPEEDEEAIARKLAEQYVRSHPSLERLVLKRRLSGYLQRKGFAVSIVIRVVDGVMG
ncbi:MAG: RecX family transcriptional regulator, partial [Ignavibacteria bacterium]